jgi:hypothetical protein
VTKLRFWNSHTHKIWGFRCVEYFNTYKDSVQELNFSDLCSFPEDFLLDGIDHCPSLTSLWLPKCRMSDTDLQQFFILNPQLERLNINSSHGFTSAIIDSLVSSCQILQHLSVPRSSPWFSDSCLLSLIALPRLKSISIQKRINLRSVIEFWKLKPHVSITGYRCDTRDLDSKEKILLMKGILSSVHHLDIAFQLSDLYLTLHVMNDLITQNNTCRQMVPPDLLPTLMNYFRKDRE